MWLICRKNFLESSNMQKKKTKASLHSQEKDKCQTKPKKTTLPQSAKPHLHESHGISPHGSPNQKNRKKPSTSKSLKNSAKRPDSKNDPRSRNMCLDLNARKNHGLRAVNEEKSRILKQALPSFRQYCIIGGEFVPLELSCEKRHIDQMLQETASTSPCQSQFFKNMCRYKPEIRDRSDRFSRIQPQMVEVGVQTLENEVKNYSILVKAAQEEIGTQYSDRKSQNSQRAFSELEHQVFFLKSKCPSQIQPNQGRPQSQNGELYEAIARLQNFQNPQSKVFQELSREQKHQFRDIFQSILFRLQSPRADPGSRLDNCSDINQLRGIQPFEKIVRENAQFQQLAFAREAKQMGELPTFIREAGQIDTSLLPVLNIFSDFFCYMELHHQETLVKAINKMYGWSYMEKFRFVSKIYRDPNQEKHSAYYITQEIRRRESSFAIINQSVFLDFMEEVMEESAAADNHSALLFHCKCIFDCINQLLRHYQPFYLTKGDPFPWSLNILKCMTFYSIDKESLETVISQIQEKLASEILNNLCGLQVEGYCCKDSGLEEGGGRQGRRDIVRCLREEKEQKMIQAQLKNEDNGPDMEVEITYLLYEVSALVIGFIFEEAAGDLKASLATKN